VPAVVLARDAQHVLWRLLLQHVRALRHRGRLRQALGRRRLLPRQARPAGPLRQHLPAPHRRRLWQLPVSVTGQKMEEIVCREQKIQKTN